MENEEIRENSVPDILERYTQDVMSLVPYLNYFEMHVNAQVSQTYNNSDIAHSMPFPVYDATLMDFVKHAENTKMIDRNYVYVYSRNRIQTPKDELMFIDDAEIKDMDDLAGILSKYIIEGRTKGGVWAQGVNNGVYYKLISKMQELIKKWS
ncbi:MAG: DUF6508 domain-containing protein [Butyrivibrio sp.]|nr:DUF6508 domain-containing protein [Butyrivibrio sp.]